MTTMLSPEIVTVPSLVDRCDSCSAAAKAEIALTSGGSLVFCGHHANKNAEKLTRVASRITVEDGFEWAAQSPPA
ncbi:DUF7455 domain-containing protein [Actinoplanes friuliensis]|nr:hypothetical protein [Actinoplanes friuliensis]